MGGAQLQYIIFLRKVWRVLSHTSKYLYKPSKHNNQLFVRKISRNTNAIQIQIN